MKTINIKDRLFNRNWLFSREARDAYEVEFDDSHWKAIALPHDWAIAGPFDDRHNARNGGLPVNGVGWYRKHFHVDSSLRDRLVSIEFDGAMCNAHVWVNGVHVGHRPSGYIGFEVDITGAVRFGEENVIAVKLHQEDLSQRWYPGAGIYRNVHIKFNDTVHIPNWGVFISTPQISDAEAIIKVQTQIANAGTQDRTVLLVTSIYDQQGSLAGQASRPLELRAEGASQIEQRLALNSPRCWEPGAPSLYTAVSQIVDSKQILDELQTEFGVRSLAFTPHDGVLLNGRRLPLQGVCLHHDQGPLGAALNVRAVERQVEIMKSMGANAIRTSHNPPAPELLQICDRLGVLVIVEAFDEWRIGKVENGYHKVFDEWHERDLRDMIRRDRNHPCVILWSIGNEILEQKRKDGWKIAKRLNDIAHDEDPTRLTTAGFNQGHEAFENNLAQQVDVVGLNYWPGIYSQLRAEFPHAVLYGSETSSMTSSRGVYHLPLEAAHQHKSGQVSSFDVIHGPAWAYPPDVEFLHQKNNPSILGEFIWTGIDYLGEPTPYGGRDNQTNGYWNDDWPSHSSYFAPVDLVGLPKDRYYLYQSQWTQAPMVHLLPHWNWEGMEGQEIPVMAYTNADEVELLVNGQSYGRRRKGVDKTMIPVSYWGSNRNMLNSGYRLHWMVPFQPGSIKAIAMKGGKVVATEEIATAGTPFGLKLEPDRTILKADGHDLSYITLTIVDRDYRHCPRAENLVSIEVKGAGSLAGVGNGNPRCLRSFKGHDMEAFSGKLMLIVQSSEEPGRVSIEARSRGLKMSSVHLNVRSFRSG